jgi:hypothetical protein
MTANQGVIRIANYSFHGQTWSVQQFDTQLVIVNHGPDIVGIDIELVDYPTPAIAQTELQKLVATFIVDGDGRPYSQGIPRSRGTEYLSESPYETL